MKSLIAVLGLAATTAVGQLNSATTTAPEKVGSQIGNKDIAPAGGFDAYYVDNGTAPWGLGDYSLAMDEVFGAGNWDAVTYADDPNTLFGASFLYLEGSDSSASELTDWLAANGTALENWVNGGGNLFINAAPNEGGNIAFPFGITLTYIDFSEQGNAAGAHPIFDGPFTPVATNYTGNFFGHGTVAGPLTQIIGNEFGSTVVGEYTGTGGTVMAGGMTAPFWITPQPESQNLLQNIISYVSGGGGDPPIVPGDNAYYVDSGSAPWGLGDYAAAMDAVFGGGGWNAATYADDALTLLGDASFIYFEGSDNSADELAAWLGANTAALEEWTNNGGKFYMNAAPNEGGDIAFPFGVTLTYIDFSDEGNATGPHPIFEGPFTPITTNYTGNFFGHGTLSGPGLTSLIDNEFGNSVVSEGTVTNGAAMYGGMAGPFWQEPQPESQNLLQNILNYVAFGAGITPGTNAYYLDSGAAPWGLGDYALAMDAVFGAGNWTAATYADDAASILADANFLYLEGSDSSADELNAWLGANGGDLEAWVNGGGSLYINAGPNEGGNIAFPFGVTLIYTDFSSNGDATGPHPIFDGPFTPVATSYTGNFFGHGTVSGAPNSIIENEFGSTVLAENVTTGGGIVMYGGMTAPFWQTPQPESQNLLQNILSYVSGGGGCYADCDGDGMLTILDFVCFQGAFQAGDPYADCDGDNAFTILDFVCYQGAFQAGCP